MDTKLDRRIPFFAVVSLICFVLYPLADDKVDHVPFVMGFVYLAFSLLYSVEWLSRRRG